MCVGGTPFYLNMFNPMFSVTQNIDELFFSEDAPLQKEFPFLFRSLFNDSITYRRIVELLGDKLKGITRSEIIKSLKLVDNGNLTEILDNLCQCDFIRKYSAYGKKQREMVYQLIDLYSLFYVKYVMNDNSQDTHKWSNMIDSGSRKAWSGYAFEYVCFNHIKEIKKALGISGVISNVSAWSKKGDDVKGTQIDLLIIRNDNVINMCELKFYSGDFEVDKEYYVTLMNRENLLLKNASPKASIRNTLITTFGLKRNEYSSIFSNVVVIDDLFDGNRR